METVYPDRLRNLSGSPSAHPISSYALPDKLSPSKALTCYSLYPWLAQGCPNHTMGDKQTTRLVSINLFQLCDTLYVSVNSAVKTCNTIISQGVIKYWNTCKSNFNCQLLFIVYKMPNNETPSRISGHQHKVKEKKSTAYQPY